MLAWAMDVVEDEPYGTGIVEARVSPDLRRIAGPVRVLARPSLPWHLFDAARTMPWKAIPGVDWERGDTVRWSTVEGPVGGLVSPLGGRSSSTAAVASSAPTPSAPRSRNRTARCAT
jgi:hypothetical protein